MPVFPDITELTPLEAMIAAQFASSDILQGLFLFFDQVPTTQNYPYCLITPTGGMRQNRYTMPPAVGKTTRDVVTQQALQFSVYVDKGQRNLLTDPATGVLPEISRLFEAQGKLPLDNNGYCSEIFMHFPWQVRYRTHDQVKMHTECYQGYTVFDFQVQRAAGGF